MVSYYVMVKTFIAELDSTEQFKRETIVKLAKQLEKEEYQTNEINDRIADDLEGYISRAYIGRILDDKYKDKSKIHKKREEIITLATDGTIIERRDKAKEDEEAEEKARLNAIGHQEFSEALDKAAEAGSKEIQNLDSAVLKELDKVRDEKKEIVIKFQDAIMTVDKQKEFLDDVKEYFGIYIKVNEEYEITDVMDSKPANELKIDLRKFEDNIKDSYKKGKYVAQIKHNGTNVTSWT